MTLRQYVERPNQTAAQEGPSFEEIAEALAPLLARYGLEAFPHKMDRKWGIMGAEASITIPLYSSRMLDSELPI